MRIGSIAVTINSLNDWATTAMGSVKEPAMAPLTSTPMITAERAKL